MIDPGTGAWRPDTISPTLLSTNPGTGSSEQTANPAYLMQQRQAAAKAWSAPSLVNGNQFQSQADVDAFKAALTPQSFGWNGGGEHATGATPILAATDAANQNAAMKWGVDQGIIPRSDPSGLPGLHSLNDFMKTWAPIIAVAAPAVAGVAGAGAAAGAGSASDELLAAHALQTGGAYAPVSAAALAPESLGLAAGAAAGTAATQAIDPATQDLIAAHGVQTGGALAPSAPSTLLGSTPGAASAAAGVIPTTTNNLGTAQAVDPIAAPISEAAPSISPGAVQGSGGGTGAGGVGSSPSTSLLDQAGNMIGHINTFAQGALAIGGLLGGLAGLQGGKSPGSPEAPPPLPSATQVGSQADAKAGLQAQGLPGGPLEGNASTWLTGASGVDPNQLNLGKSTLLGQ